MIDVQFIHIKDTGIGNYGISEDCYKLANTRARREKAMIMFLPPDDLNSNNTFENLAKLYDDGIDGVVHMANRMSLEDTTQIILDKYYDKDKCTISIPPRDLMKYNFKYPHPIMSSMIWDNRNPRFPRSHLYWEIDKYNVLMRAFYLTPLMLKPSPNPNPPLHTIDGTRYIEECCPDYNKLHIVTDTDEMCQTELCPMDYHNIGPPIRDKTFMEEKISEIVRWRWHHIRKGWMSMYHLRFLSKRIRMHIDDIPEEKWKEIEKESDKVIIRILGGY